MVNALERGFRCRATPLLNNQNKKQTTFAHNLPNELPAIPSPTVVPNAVLNAMSKHGDIVSWLSSVDCSPDFPPAPANDAKRKRDREQQQEPPSPPASESIHRHLHHHSDMSQGGPPTPKKRRLAHGLSGDGDGDREEDDEQQETPKASDKSSILQTQFRQPASPLKRTPRQRHHQPQLQSHGKPASVSSLSSLSESQHSSASGRSSPTKKIAALELNPDGLETRMLSLTNLLMPPALADMLAEMEGCGAGAGVVSRARKVFAIRSYVCLPT